MISVQVTMDAKDTKAFLVNIKGRLENRRDLNEAIALRLQEELKAHFGKKNTTPNKLGGPRSNFWQEVAAATQVAEVTDNSATVTVAEARYRIHYYGGTIRPVKAKALTIPLVREAYGQSVASYKRNTGKTLFGIPGRNALFEKVDGAAARESVTGDTKARVRGTNKTFTVRLAGRSTIRPVFALAKSVTIKQDPDAMPPQEALRAALQEQAEDYVAAIEQGGPA